MKEVRKTSENVLLLDGGNTLFGSKPLVQQTQGQAIVEAMNLLGYDAMVLGDLDFLLGLDLLAQHMKEAEFPVLSANAVIQETDQLFATPYVIKEIGGHKVAIIGLTNQEAADASGGGIVVLDPLETLEDLVDEVHWYVAPRLIGCEGIPAVGELGLRALVDAIALGPLSVRRVGPDLHIWGSIRRRGVRARSRR